MFYVTSVVFNSTITSIPKPQIPRRLKCHKPLNEFFNVTQIVQNDNVKYDNMK